MDDLCLNHLGFGKLRFGAVGQGKERCGRVRQDEVGSGLDWYGKVSFGIRGIGGF